MKSKLKHLLIDARLTFHVAWNHVLTTSSLVMAFVIFSVILFILQWLFNLEQLGFILTTDMGLSFFDKIDFLIDAWFNVFRLVDGLVPISMILISLFQAVAITLLLHLRNKKKNARSTSQFGSLTIGLLGSGCVACGGSILTPLLGAVASNVSLTLAERIGDTLLLFAVFLSYRALSKISFTYAHQMSKGVS